MGPFKTVSDRVTSQWTWFASFSPVWNTQHVQPVHLVGALLGTSRYDQWFACQWLHDITVHMGCASMYMFCNLIPSSSYYEGTISVKNNTHLHSHELPSCPLCDCTARSIVALLKPVFVGSSDTAEQLFMVQFHPVTTLAPWQTTVSMWVRLAEAV